MRSETIKTAINREEIPEIQQEWFFCALFEAKIIIFNYIEYLPSFFNQCASMLNTTSIGMLPPL